MHSNMIRIPNFNGKIVGKYQFRYVVRTRSTPHDTNLFTDVNCLLSEFNLFHCNFFIQTNENLWNWLHFTLIKSKCVRKQNNRPSGISRVASFLVGLTAEAYRNSVQENYAFFSLLVLYAALLPDLYFWSKSCALYSNFYCNLICVVVLLQIVMSNIAQL